MANILSILPANQELIKTVSVSISILLGFLLLEKIFAKYIFVWILNLFEKRKVNLNRDFMLAFEKPLRTLITITGFYIAFIYLPLSSSQDLTLLRLFRSALMILLAWGLYELSGVESLFSKDFQEKLNIDNILLTFVSKVVRFILVALAIVIVAREWNYDVNGFIAGLGLGGLAFALAAKDALANIFGGIVIILEKPLLIGDSISIPGVEGTVEDISFRSTKIRSATQSLITVPNSTLANQAINNFSRTGKRRIRFYLRVSSSTNQSKLESCINAIKNMLLDLSDVQTETVVVRFENFNENGLDILIDCFTGITASSDYLALKEDINFRIMGILEREGIERSSG